MTEEQRLHKNEYQRKWSKRNRKKIGEYRKRRRHIGYLADAWAKWQYEDIIRRERGLREQETEQ